MYFLVLYKDKLNPPRRLEAEIIGLSFLRVLKKHGNYFFKDEETAKLF